MHAFCFSHLYVYIYQYFFLTDKCSKKTAVFLIASCVLLAAVGMVRWSASRRSYVAAAAMTECFLPPSSSPAEQRRAEHQGGVARTPSSEEISPTKFPGLYRTGEPSPPHDGHHHETPDPYVSDDDKEHGKKKNKFKKKEKRSRFASFSSPTGTLTVVFLWSRHLG